MADADLSIGPPEAPQVAEPDVDELGPELGPDLDAGGAELAPEISEAQVRSLLPLVAIPPAMLLADPDVEDHWHFSDDEIDQLAPPLTRIINRRPKLRAAVARGDEAAVAVMLASWAGRNMAAGQAARRAREDNDDANQRREDHRDAEPDRTRPDGERVGVTGRQDGDPAAGVHPASD